MPFYYAGIQKGHWRNQAESYACYVLMSLYNNEVDTGYWNGKSECWTFIRQSGII